MRNIVAVVAAVGIIAACDSSTDPAPDPTLFDAELSGVESYAEVAGVAEVSATLAAFAAEIELQGLPAGSYDWELAAGSCAEPGGRIGAASAYETLTADDEGAASGSAQLNAVLTPTGAYHIGVFLTEEAGDEDVRVDVACGDLERRE